MNAYCHYILSMCGKAKTKKKFDLYYTQAVRKIIIHSYMTTKLAVGFYFMEIEDAVYDLTILKKFSLTIYNLV